MYSDYNTSPHTTDLTNRVRHVLLLDQVARTQAHIQEQRRYPLTLDPWGSIVKGHQSYTETKAEEQRSGDCRAGLVKGSSTGVNINVQFTDQTLESSSKVRSMLTRRLTCTGYFHRAGKARCMSISLCRIMSYLDQHLTYLDSPLFHTYEILSPEYPSTMSDQRIVTAVQYPENLLISLFEQYLIPPTPLCIF